MSYADFLRRRVEYVAPEGIDGADLGSHLFPHQRDIVRWALKRGRAAIFADTGLGKTAMQVEWARIVSARAGRVLIVTPLAVAEQTVRESRRFGVQTEYVREHVADSPSVLVTNYEHIEKFDPSLFAGIVLDESSILKNYTGAFRNLLIEMFGKTRFRLACTATPAPNDFMELGNHSEFLGIKSRTEMLSEYFTHDGGSTRDWRLKGHAEDAFWRWVCGWGVMVRQPSDLGHDDGAFRLPPLRMREHIIPIDHRYAWSEGFLFAPDAVSLNEQRATRRATLDRRVSKAAELANHDRPALVWCEMNDEADAIEAAIPGAVQVRGDDSPEAKVDRLLGFADGRYRVLVTKPKIAGFGMNWQHCADVVFAGASHSYEQTYQAIRRCWRFGQTRPVDVHIIRAETEGAVIANYRRKEADAERMRAAMLAQMGEIQRGLVTGSRREFNPYNPTKLQVVPTWVGQESA